MSPGAMAHGFLDANKGGGIIHAPCIDGGENFAKCFFSQSVFNARG
jgi:hypothetical protein